METYAFGASPVDAGDLRIGVLGALLVAGTALASGVAITLSPAGDPAPPAAAALGEPRAPLVVYERAGEPGNRALEPKPLGSLEVRAALVSPLGARWQIALAAAGAADLGVDGANPPARYAAVLDGRTLTLGTVVGDPRFHLFLVAETDRAGAIAIARSLTTRVEVRT
ncbi:MAG: hypothetical protein ACT4QF_18895 [Sporichthyaceae bacterium]